MVPALEIPVLIVAEVEGGLLRVHGRSSFVFLYYMDRVELSGIRG